MKISPRKMIRCLRLIVAILIATISFAALARPRPALPPLPEFDLKSWKFDQPYWLDAASLGAHLAANLQLVESWSGYALNCVGNDSLLLTPTVTGTHHNLTATNGTIRLWFAPDWSSASLGGSGPGDWATLFELQQTNGVKMPFALALSFAPDGDRIVVAVNTGQETASLIEMPISFTAGEWHQIAFVYWKSGLALAVDGGPESLSGKTPAWPDAATWNRSAFSLGSATDGQHQALGQLDEVHTFGYPLSTDYLLWNYQFCAPLAALGPLPDDKGGGAQAMMAGPGPCDPCPEGDGGGGTNNYVGGWTTNAGLKFAAMPYISNGTLYVTRLEGITSGKAYEIYRTLNLLGTSIWTRVAVGTNGQTNFSLSLTSTNVTFLAASVEDQDLDGLSDAYEHLVLGSTNTMWDTDGDGIPDGWEAAYGLNPTNRFDGTNVNANGISNLQKYLGEAARLRQVVYNRLFRRHEFLPRAFQCESDSKHGGQQDVQLASFDLLKISRGESSLLRELILSQPLRASFPTHAGTEEFESALFFGA